MKIKEGEKIPNSKVFILSKEGPKEISIGDFIGEDKTILFGVPGAFTPTCSAKHLPSFVNSMDKVQRKGIAKVICISLNDPYVMDAWGKSYNASGKITMLGDSREEFTRSDVPRLPPTLLTRISIGPRSASTFDVSVDDSFSSPRSAIYAPTFTPVALSSAAV